MSERIMKVENETHPRKEERYWQIHNWIGAANSIIAIVAVIGALTSACFAYKAFREARRQADAAFVDQRPWLRITLNFQSLRFAEGGDAIISYEVDIKNVGRSPAQHLKERMTARVVTSPNGLCATIGAKRQIALSHSRSFDQRRRPKTFLTAIAAAFFCPSRITSCLPRVTPV
jgi:hypothetical protein